MNGPALRLLFSAIVPALACAAPLFAQTSDRPLATERWECLAPGDIRLEMGVEYAHTPLVPYYFPDGDLYRLPILGATLGVAERVEIQVEGILHEWARNRNGNRADDFGDFFIWMKWSFYESRGRRPNLGGRWGIKLPNSDDKTGLGKDRSDIFFQAVASKNFGRTAVHANFGMAILEHVNAPAEQDDVLIWGLAAERSLPGKWEKWTAAAEWTGRAGKNETPAYSILKAALSRSLGKWSLDGGIYFGTTKQSPDTGLFLGATWLWENALRRSRPEAP